MVDYREILRLSSNPKNGQRMIASVVHSSRHTIHDVQEAARNAGITWPLDENVTNDALKSILFPDCRRTAMQLLCLRRGLRGYEAGHMASLPCPRLQLFRRRDPAADSG